MQKMQLSIPEPCHENWHNMTPTEQGRFCNACAKEVIDFSMMSDTEVLNYFNTLTHEKVCGRALPTQLNRNISYPKEPKKRLFWYWNYIVMFFMFFSKANTVKAQGGVKRITEISNAPACKVGETIKSSSRVISGRVTDINGNPVSFATIKIKDKGVGLSADAKGQYSIKVKPNDVLVISGASFKPTEVHVNSQSVLNTVLERGKLSDLKEVIIASSGWVSYRNLDEEIIPPVNQKYTATLLVKDDKSGIPVNNAKIIIAGSNGIDTILTNKKGSYKLKGIKEYDEYYIKVEADDYEVNEFTINGKDFKDRKKEWEVLLKKGRLNNKAFGTIGAISFQTECKKPGPLYVVDGAVMGNEMKINPEDIDEIDTLPSKVAVAIFGSNGSDGAIIITTKKTKVKSLDTVVVNSGYGAKRKLVTGTMNGTIKVINTEANNHSENKLISNFKIFPNPAQKGNSINLSLKLKEAGQYRIQIADATARIILQRQANVPAKEYTEQLRVDDRWSSGVYFINIFNNKNQLISKASFIVQ